MNFSQSSEGLATRTDSQPWVVSFFILYLASRGACTQNWGLNCNLEHEACGQTRSHEPQAVGRASEGNT